MDGIRMVAQNLGKGFCFLLILTGLVFTSSTPSLSGGRGLTVSDAGLVGYWGFEEGSGGVLSDQSGNGNHGTIHGATWTPGKQGTALNFDGVNDYVSLPSSASLTLGGAEKSFTFAAWVNRASAETNDYMFFQPCKDPSYSQSGCTNNVLHVGWRETNVFTLAFYYNGVDTPTSYTDVGEWHYWSVTYEGNTNARKIYRDAVLLVSDTANSDYLGTEPLGIGNGYNSKSFFHGLIDEARVYNRALSQEEVTQLYQGGGDTWRRVSDMPTGRWAHAAAEVDGKIYVIGGMMSWSSGTYLTTMEVYDPATDQWQSRAPVLTPRRGHAAVTVNGKIYIVGGRDASGPLTTVEEYDPATNTWRSRAPIPTPRYRLGAAVVNRRVYAIGGWDDQNSLATVEEYDPTTNTWRNRASMSTARQNPAVASIGDRLYAIGGNDGTNDLATIEEYDPFSDSWQSQSSMQAPRANTDAKMVNGRIYVIGGVDASFKFLAGVEEYDPASNVWTTRAPMSTARRGPTLTVVNGMIYVIGGTTAASIGLTTVEEYTPPSHDVPTVIGWIAGWNYRKSHTIKGSTVGPLTNYQVLFNIHYGSGVDSGDTVYLQGQGRPDFGDLRFTTSDGQTELDYWIEEKVNGDSARVWVEVEFIPANPTSTTIYVYYDNSIRTTTSNGAETFLFFEDFSGDLSQWTSVDGTWSLENGRLMLADENKSAQRIIRTNDISFPVSNIALYVDTEYDNQNSQRRYPHLAWAINSDGSDMYYVFAGHSNINVQLGRIYKFVDDSPSVLWAVGGSDVSWVVPNQSYELLVWERSGTRYADYYVNDVLRADDWNLGTDLSSGGFGVLGTVETNYWFDNMRVRKYVDPEPTHDSWGSVETSGAPTVTVVSPNGGEYWRDTQPITWTATDPQDDPLTYTVYYSPNSGQTWTQMATGLTTLAYTWDTTTVVDGANYLIKVEASDGEYTGVDTSDVAFELVNALLTTATIPSPNTTVTENAIASLTTTLTTTSALPTSPRLPISLLVIIGLGLIVGLGVVIWVISKRRGSLSEPVTEHSRPTDPKIPTPVQEYDPEVALATLKQLAKVYERVAWQKLLDEFHFTEDKDLEALLFRAGLSDELELKIDDMTKMVRLQVVEAVEPLTLKKFTCSACGEAMDPQESNCSACGETFPPCIICRRPIHEDLTKTPCCGAYAHTPHIKEWIRIRGTCPVCREKVQDWMLP